MCSILKLSVLGLLLLHPICGYAQSPDDAVADQQELTEVSNKGEEANDVSRLEEDTVKARLQRSVVRVAADSGWNGLVISRSDDRAIILWIEGKYSSHVAVGSRHEVAMFVSDGSWQAAALATCISILDGGHALLQIDNPDSNLRAVRISPDLPSVGQPVLGILPSTQVRDGVVTEAAEWEKRQFGRCRIDGAKSSLSYVAVFDVEESLVGLPQKLTGPEFHPETFGFRPALDIVHRLIENNISVPESVVESARARRVKHRDAFFRPISGKHITISWSDDHDELHGFSQSTGEWAILPITKQDIIEPVVGEKAAAVQLGGSLAAFSSQTGTWDVLELPEPIKWGVDSEGVKVFDTPGHYLFSVSAGQWTSPSDPDFRPVELKIRVANGQAGGIANQFMGAADWRRGLVVDVGSDRTELIFNADQKRKLRRVFVSKQLAGFESPNSFDLLRDESVNGQILEMREFKFPKGGREKLVERFNAAGFFVIPQDDRLQVFGTSKQLRSVATQLTDLAQAPRDGIDSAIRVEEQMALELAGRLRAAKAVSDGQRTELRKLVADALEVRLARQKVQVEQLKAKLSKVEKAWTERQRATDRIVERRVEELLAPNVNWETVNTPIRNTRMTTDWPVDYVVTDSTERPLTLSPTMTAQEARAAVAESGATSVAIAAPKDADVKTTSVIYKGLADHVRILGSYENMLQQHMKPADNAYAPNHPAFRENQARLQQRCQRGRQELLQRIGEYRTLYRAYEFQVRMLELNVEEAQSKLEVAIHTREERAETNKTAGRAVFSVAEMLRLELDARSANVALKRAQEQLSVFQAVVDESPHFNPAHPETAKLIRYIETVDVLDVERSGKVPSPQDMKLPDTP